MLCSEARRRGLAQGIQRDGQAAGRRARERCKNVGRDRERNERTASIDSTHSFTSAKAGQRRDHRAEADQARDAESREHRGIRARIDRLLERGKALIVQCEQGHDCREQRDDNGPHAADSGERCPAPFFLGEKTRVEARSTKTLMARLTRMTTTSGRIAVTTEASCSRGAVRSSCWIEFARDGGALAQGRTSRRLDSVPTSAKPSPSPGDFLGAGEPSRTGRRG